MAASPNRPPNKGPTRSLTVKQAAKAAGCSESLVRTLVESGEVPSRTESYGVRGQEWERIVIDRSDLPRLKRKVKLRQSGRSPRGPQKSAPQWWHGLSGWIAGERPSAWAEARKRALEQLLNADLTEGAVLKDLVDVCRDDWYGGGRANLNDEDLAPLRVALEAVVHYCRAGEGEDKTETALLQDLHRHIDWPTELGPDREWEMGADGYLREVTGEAGPLVARTVLPSDLAHFIAGYYMGTAEKLFLARVLPPLRCKRAKCRRWFVPLKPDKECCCESCRRKHDRGE